MGTSYGVYGETGADDLGATNPLFATAPLAGVAGYSGLINPASERNGVAGLSKNSNGVFGISHRNGTYANSASPVDIRAGVRGATPNLPTSEDNFAVAGIGDGYEGTGVLGIGTGVRGHGVIGISGPAITTPPSHTQVGVWGLTREQPWASFKTSFPLTDNTASKKSQVAVLGQAINFVAVWGESDGQTGVVGTSGSKKGLVALPSNKHIGVYGRSSQVDGQGVYGEADSSLGVYGISRSASFADAGVVGEGQGADSNAAALEIRNGAIRVSGIAKPAGKETVMVMMGFGWMPVVTGAFACPTCTHGHVQAYETEFTITNPLVNSTRSIIQLTVEDPVFAMIASIKTISNGSFDIRVVLPYGAVPQVDLPLSVTVHYLIINE